MNQPLRWIHEAAGGDPEAEKRMRERWEAGEPLQYVLGRWGFREHDLVLDRRALIPRPETEMLVEVALALAPGAERALDLGTGTGAVALALSSGLRSAEVWAVEASPGAASLARQNLGDTAVRLVEGSWYDPLPTELRHGFDLIVSNPPYVSAAEWADLDPVVRDWEPKEALVAGPSGLEFLELIVMGATDWLSPGGGLALECAPHQTGDVAAMAIASGFTAVAVHHDLARRERIVTARTG